MNKTTQCTCGHTRINHKQKEAGSDVRTTCGIIGCDCQHYVEPVTVSWATTTTGRTTPIYSADSAPIESWMYHGYRDVAIT